MTQFEQEQAAKRFIEFWKEKGDEKSDTQRFWISLLHDVFGVEDPTKFIEFEKRVKIENKSFIDGYIPSTKVLIEQKSISKDLNKTEIQSDKSELTPYGQAKRYSDNLDYNERARWIITCNFKEFQIYDMDKIHSDPIIIKLEELPKQYHVLQFLIDSKDIEIQKEEEVSFKAGELVGKLYDEIVKLYINPENEETLKSLNMLCVRIVFCLYAEDAGLFGKHNMFHDYIEKFSGEDLREGLIKLFKILDTPKEERDPYLKEELAQFPYVNGGLFEKEDIEIPRLNDRVKNILLNEASGDFDWSEISPTIFGAVFESTLNPETRRSGGMHYTSIENIHKVIDPLFLNELKYELDTIIAEPVLKTRKKKLLEYQDKLANLKFLDPACGSGNFLTESYLSIRRLENKMIASYTQGQIQFGAEELNPIKVSIKQFYGIEINDFAVTVAKTALWIAEAQMYHETQEIINMRQDFLPLKTYTHITEGNALRIEWNEVVNPNELNFIMGNPPFVGYYLQNDDQKKDLKLVYGENEGVGKIDYVAGWYYKAAKFMSNTQCKCAFVSTNSITQGEQVAFIWKPIYNEFNIDINFAYKTFKWNSEASLKAQVFCVIIGFSDFECKKDKIIYDNNSLTIVNNISPYLVDTSNIFVDSRSKPICDVPKMSSGGKPVEGGFLIFTKEEMNEFIKKEPESKQYFRPFVGASDYINNHIRFCLWLNDIEPNELRKMPFVMKRVEEVRNFRLQSKKEATRKCANTPTKFMEIKQPNTDYLLIPATSSDRRKYIPIGYLNKNFIASNAASFVPAADLYHFGILTSNVHMAWMRVVAGRLGTDYRYSINVVYNNFPWPIVTDKQKEKIEKTAKNILDIRNSYTNSSLADLYDPLTMPSDLFKAHKQNDAAVMEAYGFDWRKMSEDDCVAELMKMYQELVNKEKCENE